MKAKLIKLKESTHLFNANQKCFVLQWSGDEHCYVAGKYRGANRYIKAWVKKDNISKIIEIEAEEEFLSRLWKLPQ